MANRKMNLKINCRRKKPLKTPGNMVIVDPDKPQYEKLHLCIYMRELMDEADKERGARKGTEKKVECKP